MYRLTASSLMVMLALTQAAAAQEIRLVGLDGRVSVYRDQYAIPHVYANSWEDAARVLGYLHATDRLWQMDLLRRKASGTMAALMGEDALNGDMHMRRLGIRRGCEALWESGELPADFVAELDAYADGVNAAMRLQSANGFGEPFASMGYEPEPWTPVDSLVFVKYMGWDQSGTDDDLWLGIMVEKLGAETVEELWPIDRPYESPQVKEQADGQAARNKQSALHTFDNAERAYTAALRAMQGALSPRGDAFGSNNWAVDGTKTRSGKPMLASDPHLGFDLPSIWYAAHVCVNGENVAGVTFPTSPHFIIAHNDALGWGITNLQADAVDYFVEEIDPNDAARYRHKGEWNDVETVTEIIEVKGAGPHTMVIESTVHGPIISREGRTISMQWTGLGPTTESVGIWKMNRAKNLPEWLDGADKLDVPAISLAYADIHGTIAMYGAGTLPKRAHGQGRTPMDGASGEHDWDEMIPKSEMPLEVNPERGFVVSANARPIAKESPHYLGWMWDPSYRLRRINNMLAKADDLTIASMRAIQYDIHDMAAESFLPSMLEELKDQPISDPIQLKAIEALKNWNYVARVDTVAPAIWLRWLDHYRGAVWDPQWASRNIEKESGSWGFTGINRREPTIEVLEYLTREKPDSPWFDNPTTSWTETRRDIAFGSFITAIGTLRRQLGEDIAGWEMRNTNILRVNSLLGIPELRRTGPPVPGTPFTVNPGGNIGHVGGGASWRMIVDFGDPTSSVGVYPGGQSADATSPHYDDLMPIWAVGDHVSLNAESNPDDLPEETRSKSLNFVP